MEQNIMENAVTAISADALYNHWKGHRGLTRRIIEAFPEDKLFTHSIGGMRTFATMAMELICLADAGMKGIVTGEWTSVFEMDYHTGANAPQTKEELLQQWDAAGRTIDELWPQVVPHMHKVVAAFNAYEGPVYSNILYWIDNEIHHRGEGYVYLRSLGVEPPAFWDRQW